jgi:4-diphosphocytidyl-2C-methyl-D-erythritol kinase
MLVKNDVTMSTAQIYNMKRRREKKRMNEPTKYEHYASASRRVCSTLNRLIHCVDASHRKEKREEKKRKEKKKNMTMNNKTQ